MDIEQVSSQDDLLSPNILSQLAGVAFDEDEAEAEEEEEKGEVE